MKRVWLFAACVGLAACAPSTERAAPPALAGALPAAPGVYSGGRLAAADAAHLADAGVRQVLDLSMANETPDFDEAAALREAGIAYARLPIDGAAGLTRRNVEAFDRLLGEAPRPLLVHCASGNRVGALAALRAGWLQGATAAAALEEGRRWGLRGLEPAVRALLEPGGEQPSSAGASAE